MVSANAPIRGARAAAALATFVIQGALTLGRVNARHETLKTVINRVFRGVSTARLPNYLTLLRLSPNKERDPMDLLRAALWGREPSPAPAS